MASLHEPTPSRVLGVLNTEMLRHGDADMFCTTAYAHALPAADGGLDLRSRAAATLPGSCDAPAGGIEEVGGIGTLLGVRDEVQVTDELVHLAPGDALVLYTDGVTERRDGSRACSARTACTRRRGGSAGAAAEELCAVIEQTIFAYSPDPPQDDVAVVVIRPVP